MKMKKCGVIMAGGGGTRFWPLSRKNKPKQLLNLSGNDLLVNEALSRLRTVVEKEDAFIVTNRLQAATMVEATGDRMYAKNVLVEPAARNTAACIGYAAMRIVKKYGDGVMIVTPSDAVIKNTKMFTEVLNRAAEEATQFDRLVTVGIQPTFAATGYGYIRYKDSENAVKEVDAFVEKPNVERAERYLKEGGYAWNSGMFIWKASVILRKIEELLPDVYAPLVEIYKAMDTPNETEVLERVYPNIPSISIDYGVLERCGTGEIACISAELGWSDVGSWDMLNVLHSEDENGNVARGNVVSVDAKDCVFYSGSGKLITAVGVENLVVVETGDCFMICPKDKAQDVKKIVEKLSEKGMEEFL